MGYFRPLIMAILKNVSEVSERALIFNTIERFIFIEFRLNQTRRNYRDSEFYNAAREFDSSEKTIEDIVNRLNELLSPSFSEDGTFKSEYFYNYMKKRFTSGERSGYYGWNCLRYFLYEYELSLLSNSIQQKVSWDDLLKTPKDKISIEHIFPQTPNNDYWKEKFNEIEESEDYKYQGSIGNLLLLSSSINSSLQNDGFDKKKQPKFNENNRKIRNGYSDGSHSEIEVSDFTEWSPITIRQRGLKLLGFIQDQWDIRFKDQEEMEKLLFLDLHAE